MSKTLVETLDSMTATHAGKSQTARLRAVFVHVEKALRSGVSRQAVLDALNQDGFTLSMQSFEKALYRIRKTELAGAVTKPKKDRQELESPRSNEIPKESPTLPSEQPISTDSKQESPISQLLEQHLKNKPPQNGENIFAHISAADNKRQKDDPYYYNPVPDKDVIYGEQSELKKAEAVTGAKEISQGNFRQSLKKIREDVENTNWDDVINNHKNPGRF